MGGMPVALPMVPVVAANLWNVGVLVGVGGILLGESTGYPWLEFPRAAAVLLFAAFLLIAVSAAATFGWRREASLFPAHWFLFAALLWFPWIYSTAGLFLAAGHVPRGMVQSVIDWWFGNNLVFVWLALAGIGIAFYFLPKIAGRPLAGAGYTLFAFLTLIFFGTWCGIPVGAPVPAWLPTVSTVAAMLSLPAVLAIAAISLRTACGAKVVCQGGPFCFLRFGLLNFFLGSMLYLGTGCPRFGHLAQFTWVGVGQVQLQLLGFFSMIVLGAIYEILTRTSGLALPFPKLAKTHFYLAAAGVLLYAVPLVIGGVEQGMRLQNPSVPFAEANAAALVWLRISSTGQILLLLGSLLFALNIFVMTIKWKIALGKSVWAAVTAPLPVTEVKA
jgi:cytochrome c oxidase cbb3-type subunit 1